MARVEPRTFAFEDLIQQVYKGVLRCPRFQRSFVWRGDQVLDFFDSIRMRYPVGSLLIWRTPERYASFNHVGPIPVPANEPKAPAEVGYILDGHQRVSVIFGVAALSDARAESLHGAAERVFLVFYDLDVEKFVHVRYPKDHHLPVRYLLAQDDRLATWVDQRREQTGQGSPERARWDEYRRRATQLQTIFAQYRLPYLDVTDSSLNEAVNIFCRVNSQGTAVKRSEVFAALTWGGDFDFASEAKLLLERFPKYTNFGTDPILRSLLAALKENVYESNWEDVLERHRSDLPTTLEVVGDAYGRALQFLEASIGASSGKVVPYSLHIVMLTEFFRLAPDPDDIAKLELGRWLWATAFAASYTSAGNLQLNDAVERARRLAAGEQVELLDERPRIRPLPRHFHSKSARVRAFHLFLKQLGPRDPATGELLDGMLDNGMADARVLTRPRSSEALRLAGRFLLGASYRHVRDAFEALARRHAEPGLFDGTTSTAEILRSHCIPESSLPLLLEGNIEAFLDQRETALIDAERNFAKQYVDINDVERSEEEPEIDVEENPED